MKYALDVLQPEACHHTLTCIDLFICGVRDRINPPNQAIYYYEFDSMLRSIGWRCLARVLYLHAVHRVRFFAPNHIKASLQKCQAPTSTPCTHHNHVDIA